MKTPRFTLALVILAIAASAIVIAKPANLYRNNPVIPVIKQHEVQWLGKLVYMEEYSEHGHRFRELMSHEGVEIGLRGDGTIAWRPAVAVGVGGRPVK